MQDDLQVAMKKPELRDSLGNMFSRQGAWLKEHVTRYRTAYRSNPAYTRYTGSHTNLGSITKLSINNSNLEFLPDSLYLFPNLTELELVNTRVAKIPKKLNHLPALKKITLLNNRPVRKLKLTPIKGVETLAIRDDEFNRLPRKFRKLKNLKTLDLSRNNLLSFPDIRKNKSLTRVLLTDNKLTLDDLRYGHVGLEELVLTSNIIRRIPMAIGKFPGLKKLNLNSNQVEDIASEISALKNLQELSLYKNNIKSVPLFLYDLPALRVIDLYFNQIEQFDPAIINWSKLEILYAANNKLFSLPENVGKLSGLRELYIHHNRLSTLPQSLGNMDSLRVLRVNDNFLIELPDRLYQLRYLENLDIGANRIQHVPKGLFDFPRLKLLSLYDNPLEPEVKRSVIRWAEQATQERKIIVHLDNPGEPVRN